MERRVAPRKQIELNLTCRTPAIRRPGTIHDISDGGCRLEQHGARMELGGTALLEVPGLGRLSGHIVWNHGSIAGIQFERPLSRKEAAALGLVGPDEEASTASDADQDGPETLNGLSC